MRIAVIGAGLAGLTAAYEIQKLDKDAQVEVFEAADRPGGKLRTVPFEAGLVDVGAEAFLARRGAAREFFEELGLGDQIVSPSGLRSLVYTGGALENLPGATVMGIPATSEPVAHLVSAETAARIDAEKDADPIDWPVGGDLNVGALVRQRYGDEVVDHAVSALLGGVYSCTADDLGVRATIPQLAATLDEMERPTLSGAVQKILDSRPAPAPGAKPAPVFGAFKRGYQQVYETLAEKSTVYVDAFIAGISREGESFTLKGADGRFDRVLLATPAPTVAMLLRDVAPETSAALQPVKLASSVVVAMHFESDEGLPQNSGVLIASDEPGVHAKAFTFSSRKWPHIAEFGGATVRASFGRFGDDAVVRADEDDLVDWALDDLQKITGFDGRAAGLKEIYVQRWFGGIPRYDENHLAAVAAAKAGLTPGIEVTGAWAGGVGVPAIIADARAAAARILA
ncbi:protoporphyrinogen oxidase [Corynebacterium renale]|uniref:Coproporphyrinogen III oxidase n=1 Tax=Corynebacterium renale TaxID=1724 RepID=A0A2A9DN41_9CORY|nr:protoporphyrinogen oxidase [Corynebacterium renale]PFG27319.1 oxygen-dependent protoporphyrinogen oxidase [Corynebacterium renale]SQI23595.1 protoporphyrinogen oxidase [Corynebacterium renale]